LQYNVATPGKVLRNLDGIPYWVLEDHAQIAELVNDYVRKEWESDNRDRGKDPKDSRWIRSLPSRHWRLTTLALKEVKENPEIITIQNKETGYDFAERLETRKADLKREIEQYGAIIRPLILRGEDMQLMDGYCRFYTLRDFGVPRVYAYIGYQPPDSPGR